jgi:stress response protein YsnF
MTDQTRNTPTGTAPDSPVEMVRSEEQLRVRTTSEVTGRVRLVKRVVSEERVVTVTVRREELVVEHLPPDDGTASGAGPDASTPAVRDVEVGAPAEAGSVRAAEPTLELLLCEEEIEVVTRVVPRERVRVFVDTVTELVEVGDDLAREVVEVDSTPATPGSATDR